MKQPFNMILPAFHYLAENAFESDLERQEIRKKGELMQKNREISEESLLLGAQYIPSTPEMSPPLSIEWINNEIGYGVFTTTLIQKDSFVCEYVGTIRKNDSRRYLEPLNDYCYQYPIVDERGVNYIIDSTSGNLSRFINHSFSPNLRPVYAFKEGYLHLIFLAIKDIQPHTQLLFNYGKNYWYLRGQPFPL